VKKTIKNQAIGEMAEKFRHLTHYGSGKKQAKTKTALKTRF